MEEGRSAIGRLDPSAKLPGSMKEQQHSPHIATVRPKRTDARAVRGSMPN